MNIKTIVCGMLEANCYIVESNDVSVIIDPGFLDSKLLAYAKENAEKIKYIFLTHRHFDHVNAAVNLRKITDAKIVVHKLDECGLYSDEKSLTAMCGYVYGTAEEDARADVLVADGDEITVGDLVFKVKETPGHSPGSVTYHIDKTIFCGDVLFKGSIGRTDFPEGNVVDMRESLKALSALPDDTVVYSGHGPSTTIGYEKMTNYYMF